MLWYLFPNAALGNQHAVRTSSAWPTFTLVFSTVSADRTDAPARVSVSTEKSPHIIPVPGKKNLFGKEGGKSKVFHNWDRSKPYDDEGKKLTSPEIEIGRCPAWNHGEYREEDAKTAIAVSAVDSDRRAPVRVVRPNRTPALLEILPDSSNERLNASFTPTSVPLLREKQFHRIYAQNAY